MKKLFEEKKKTNADGRHLIDLFIKPRRLIKVVRPNCLS